MFVEHRSQVVELGDAVSEALSFLDGEESKFVVLLAHVETGIVSVLKPVDGVCHSEALMIILRKRKPIEKLHPTINS